MRKQLIGLIMFVYAATSYAASPCTKNAAENLGKLYSWSFPLEMPEADFLATVKVKRSLLTREGDVIRCAKMLGQRLAMLGIKAYDPQAFERVIGMGPVEFAPEVAKSINRDAGELAAIGDELMWLGQVLPYAAEGDNQPFLTTGSPRRRQLREVLALYGQIPGMKEIIKNMGAFIDPIVKDKIFMLAMMVGG